MNRTLNAIERQDQLLAGLLIGSPDSSAARTSQA